MEEDRLENGYIDLRVNYCIEGLRKKYEKEYNCLKEIDSFFYKIQDELILKYVSQQNTFIMASLIQLQKMYDSSILLFERGLVEAGNALIRPILELSFKIIEVINNEDFVEDLFLDEQYEILTLLNELEEHRMFDIISEKEIIEYKENVKSKINNRKRPKTKTNYLVNKNGLHKEYILYRLQCDYVHQSTGIIGNIIKANSEGKLYIDADFQLENLKKSLEWLSSITMIAVKKVLEKYIKEDDLSKEFNDILKRFEICFEVELQYMFI